MLSPEIPAVRSGRLQSSVSEGNFSQLHMASLQTPQAHTSDKHVREVEHVVGDVGRILRELPSKEEIADLAAQNTELLQLWKLARDRGEMLDRRNKTLRWESETRKRLESIVSSNASTSTSLFSELEKEVCKALGDEQCKAEIYLLDIHNQCIRRRSLQVIEFMRFQSQ